MNMFLNGDYAKCVTTTFQNLSIGTSLANPVHLFAFNAIVKMSHLAEDCYRNW